MDAQFTDRQFRIFESWLDRISSWGDHDGLVHYLIAPIVAANPDARQECLSLGEIARSLAPAGGLCSTHSRHKDENVLPRNRETFRLAARRSGRYGAERPGLAYSAVSDENSRARSTPRVADCLRNLA